MEAKRIDRSKENQATQTAKPSETLHNRKKKKARKRIRAPPALDFYHSSKFNFGGK